MNSRLEALILVLAAISVVLIFVDYAYVLSDEHVNIVYALDGGIVVILGLDFVQRMRASGNPSKFILKHWYEIPAFIPLFMFALIETNLLIGVTIRGIRLVRIFRLVHLFFRTTTLLRNNRFAELLIFSAGVVIVGGIAVFIAEVGHPDATIKNIGDAFWWAIVTVTTVGYGDVYPTTPEGRVIGAVMMVTGVGILAVTISRLGAALMEPHLKGHSHISMEVKVLIKKRIDSIEQLNEEDFITLISMIKSLRDNGNAK